MSPNIPGLFSCPVFVLPCSAEHCSGMKGMQPFAMQPETLADLAGAGYIKTKTLPKIARYRASTSSLGGIMDESNAYFWVLVLSAIPALGFLFGSQSKIPPKYHKIVRFVAGTWLIICALLVATY